MEYAYHLCHCPVETPPTPPLICLMDRGGLHRGICLLRTIHTLCHIHWMCFNSKSVLLYTWHLLHLSILERDPPLLLSWRFLPFFPPWRVVWELFLIWCEVLEQGCLYVQIVKHSGDKFVICENGLYKYTELNWIACWSRGVPVICGAEGRRG